MSRNASRIGLHGSFRTTCWTEVLNARADSPDAEAAFTQLYRDYWPPVYGYLRRRTSHSDAEEIAQAFFVSLIEKDRLSRLQREGGRFRSFLLASLQNFLTNHWDRVTALKRGAGIAPTPLHCVLAEESCIAPKDGRTAELLYDREWALLLLERALQRLECEFSYGRKQALFGALRPHLQAARGGEAYTKIAGVLGMSESAVKVALHRMRLRYGELLREEIRRTVGSAAEVQEELRHLIQVVGGS